MATAKKKPRRARKPKKDAPDQTPKDDAQDATDGDVEAKADELVDNVLNAVHIRANYRRVSIDKLRANPWNPNQQSEFMYDRQGRSILRFGFLQAVLVRSGDNDGPFKDGTFEIIDGEHRWRKMVELGAKEIVVNDIGNVPDHEAKALTDILNRLRGEDDKTKKAELIHGLITEFAELKDVLPYTESDFEEFGNIANFDWDGLGDDAPPGDGGGGGADAGQHSFQVKLSDDQKEVVDRAIDLAKQAADTQSAARALELICADYIAGAVATDPD